MLRVLAAFGIVYFHSGVRLGHDFAYSGLVVFVVMLAYFSTSHHQPRSIGARARRCLAPFVVWSGVYALFNVALHNPALEEVQPWDVVLAGTAGHLWFLPFAFAVQVALDRIWGRVQPRTLAIAALVMSSALLVSAPLWRGALVVSTMGQWLHALPAVGVGVYLGLRQGLDTRVGQALTAWLFVLGVAMLMTDLPGMSVTYGVGILASGVLLSSRSIIPQSSAAIALGKLTLGIYLAHPALVTIFRHVGLDGFALAVATFGAAAVGIWCAHRVLPQRIMKYVA